MVQGNGSVGQWKPSQLVACKKWHTEKWVGERVTEGKMAISFEEEVNRLNGISIHRVEEVRGAV